MKTKTHELISPIDFLNKCITTSKTIMESAETTRSQLEGRKPVQVEIGGFYRTVDKSQVFVVGEREKCSCSLCSGQGTTPQEIIRQQLGKLLGADVEAEPGEPETVPVPVMYEVVVLVGGHGIKELNGEKPGEIYGVDANGMILFGQSNNNNVFGDLVSMLGLCLVEQLRYVAVSGEKQ